jgi:hypothetical protein
VPDWNSGWGQGYPEWNLRGFLISFGQIPGLLLRSRSFPSKSIKSKMYHSPFIQPFDVVYSEILRESYNGTPTHQHFVCYITVLSCLRFFCHSILLFCPFYFIHPSSFLTSPFPSFCVSVFLCVSTNHLPSCDSYEMLTALCYKHAAFTTKCGSTKVTLLSFK